MTRPILSPQDQRLLNRAASLLDLVGRYADDEAGLMAVHALRAADLLACAGGRPRALRMRLSAHEARAAVRQALRALAELSPEVFEHIAVVEATDAAHIAFTSR